MWLFFCISTTLLWGVAELFYKKGAHPDEKYAHLKTAAIVGIVMGLHACFMLLTTDMGYDPINIIYYLPVSLCYIVSMALSYFGMRFIEESISDPIENTSGAICAIFSLVFLGLPLGETNEDIALKLVAIAMITVGILGVGFLERTGATDRRKKLGKTMAVVAFAMPFCYAILDALGTMLDVVYLDIETSPLANLTEETIENVANTSYELTFLIVAIILIIFMRTKHVKMEIPKQKDKIIAAICETAGQFTYVYALSDAGAIAAPILSSVCIVSLLLSRIFLKEKLTWLQYVFIAVIIAGILIIATVEGV